MVHTSAWGILLEESYFRGQTLGERIKISEVKSRGTSINTSYRTDKREHGLTSAKAVY